MPHPVASLPRGVTGIASSVARTRGAEFSTPALFDRALQRPLLDQRRPPLRSPLRRDPPPRVPARRPGISPRPLRWRGRGGSASHPAFRRDAGQRQADREHDDQRFGQTHEVDTAREVIKAEKGIKAAFKAIRRQLLTSMIEDPRPLSQALDMLWIATAIERVGNHARNIAENVIYAVTGVDLGHSPAKRVNGS
ncbi:PhoU domain-containing protein [Accumulibacter sp.]|uniref:phosphate signaling complex PhoU family protein n=1 Tax=Accumulibacter sp. TaxID=2053492 RepID=UPI0025F858AC|nr:PhoU domain-containing protein [Accumulibacter sp.]MCM8625306.1 hypothetical protein [Accumulibacter sp.]